MATAAHIDVETVPSDSPRDSNRAGDRVATGWQQLTFLCFDDEIVPSNSNQGGGRVVSHTRHISILRSSPTAAHIFMLRSSPATATREVAGWWAMQALGDPTASSPCSPCFLKDHTRSTPSKPVLTSSLLQASTAMPVTVLSCAVALRFSAPCL